MSWVASAIVVSAAFTENRKRAGAKKARKQQKQDEAQQRRTQAFSETEGEGVGNLGKISLELDDETTSNVKSTRSSVRI